MGAIIGAAVRAVLMGMVSLFSGWKASIFALVTVTLGIVLYNLVVEITEEVMDFALAAVGVYSANIPDSLIQLTGIGLWCAEKVGLSSLIGLAVTFISAKWMIVKIPFLKW